MNLVIDVGNTNAKLAVFQEGKLLKKNITNLNNLLNEFENLIVEFKNISRGIISSVARIDITVLESIKKKIDLLVLTSDLKIPFNNKYETPKTLGVDRIALVCAAVNRYPVKNVLIIDAGTCITFDFINNKNVYLGGAISPGIDLRYKSLNNLTANLPLLKPKHPRGIVGKSTEESIHSGVINGIIAEIEGIVKKYKKNHKDLTVILTGGDTDFLSKRLKNTIFADSNFLLQGLNHILEYNLIQ
ncbi:type III pantothenate kinase [Flavobacteriaceae bacterium AU392]|nr:type III pantothenate kinase [Flavobacteriaceae bacterium]RKM86949.1 type III pantothenate kinase [Flavobacteriaceae bacterium AU392]